MGNQTLALQRKDLDAAHAAAHGIRIPQMFATFEKARDFVLKKDGKLILRTEHPLEREGLSGLNMSHRVSLEDVVRHEERGGLFASFRGFDADLHNYMMREWHKKHGSAKYYCEWNGISIDDYVAGLVHSYWEYVSGYNIYVVADPVVNNRYRLFAGWKQMIKDREQHVTSYDTFDGTTKLTSGNTSATVLNKLDDILRLYNKVRELFGEEMCWVVEMQLAANGELYFLQRSTGKSFRPCDWSFDAPESCHFLLGHQYGYGDVRGTTPKEGITLPLLMERGTRVRWLKDYRFEAVLNAHIISNVVEQKTIESHPAYVQCSEAHHGDGARDPHSVILPVVKAPLYLYMPDMHDRLPSGIAEEVKRLGKEKRKGVRNWYSSAKHMVELTLHIRSDGNEARVNIVKAS